jgi:hypothetical protein
VSEVRYHVAALQMLWLKSMMWRVECHCHCELRRACEVEAVAADFRVLNPCCKSMYWCRTPSHISRLDTFGVHLRQGWSKGFFLTSSLGLDVAEGVRDIRKGGSKLR